MSRILQFGFLLFLFFGFSNCQKEELDPSVFINIEDDFYINMFEDITQGEGLFNITLKSIKDQDCQNAIIDYSLELIEEEDKIVLSINDIIDPESCIPGNAPAFSSVPIENIKEQSYLIQINLKDVVFNNGTLTKGPRDYFLSMNTDNGIELVNNQLFKIPENTLWGYVGYEEEEKEMIAENFIKDLEDLTTNISFTGLYNVGYYSYFTIFQDHSITLEEEVEDKLHNTFIFQNSGEYQDIVNLIESYCSANPDMNFYVFSDDGGILNCQ